MTTATDKLEAAEKKLKTLEQFGQEVAHSRSDLIRAQQDGDKAKIAAAVERLKKATAAAEAADVDERHIAAASQAVLDAREEVAKEGKK